MYKLYLTTIRPESTLSCRIELNEWKNLST